MPKVRIYVAGIGTTVYDPRTGETGPSVGGQLWYELVPDSGASSSVGFGSTDYAPFGDGHVIRSDTSDYQSYLDMIEINITQSQYQSLLNFGNTPSLGGFDATTYNVINNSCVDFVVEALEYSGLAPKTMFDGFLTPQQNIPFLEIVGLYHSFEGDSSPYEKQIYAGTESVADLFETSETRSSPLVMDVNGVSGIQLASVTGTDVVYWDIDQDGFREASGWVSSGEGLLAIDKNNDGVINDNGELFGNGANFANGFAALDAYDSTNDNLITSADAGFANLRVWIDTNQNGYSEGSELHTLSELGITSISTTWTDVNVAANDNQKVAERPAARLMNLKRWAA